MAITATALESAKRIAHLEAQRSKLEEEKAVLKDDVLTAKAREELMKDKYWKAKGQLLKAYDVFESEKSKWREEEEIWEKFWQAESDKAMLEIDLGAVWRRSEDEADYAVRSSSVMFDAENEGLKCLLQGKEFAIGTLLGENATFEAALVKLEAENLELLQKMEALKRDKDAEICELKMDKDVNANNALEVLKKEIDVLAGRNAALEAAMEAMEEEHKKKVSEMSRSIAFLEREKRQVEEEINRISCEKRAMEGESEKVVSALKLEIRESEDAISQVKREKTEEMEKMLKEKADLKEKNLDLDLRADVLEREKQDLTTETERISREKVALKEECDKKILKFVTRAHILEKEKREADENMAALNAKHDRIEEMNKMLKEKAEGWEMKIRELLQKMEALERERGNKDDEIHKLKKDKSIAADRIANTSNALEVQKQETDKARETIKGLVGRVAILEAGKEYEKRSMEDEHKKRVLELTNSIEALEEEKRELVAKLTDSREEINRISCEKSAMKDKSEMEALEHARSIEVLEWEIREKEAGVSQVRREKSEEIQNIINKMEALKEEHEKKNMELVSRVDELEREKKKMEDEAYQAKSANLKEKSDKTDEIKRILKEKEDLKEECNREISKLFSRVHTLEREKRLSLKESRDKTAEINKILNEKATMKEQHDKKISEVFSSFDLMASTAMDAEAKSANLKGKNSELFSRVGILEKEKQELEVDIREKDEMIKVLKQQNECLAANKAIMGRGANRRVVIKSEEDVESPQCTHPTGQNQGKRLVDESVREPQRRKLEALGCSVTNQVVTKRYKSK